MVNMRKDSAEQIAAIRNGLYLKAERAVDSTVPLGHVELNAFRSDALPSPLVSVVRGRNGYKPRVWA